MSRTSSQTVTLKQAVHTALMKFIYQRSEEELHDRLKAIMFANCDICKVVSHAIIYKGNMYSSLSWPTNRYRLDESLNPAMDEYLADHKAIISYEKPYVDATIKNLLAASNHSEDFLKLFPASFHDAFSDLITTHPQVGVPLSTVQILQAQKKAEKGIAFMKQRLVLNLLY